MIQGGCPQGTGTGGPGYKFEDEINPHKIVRGALAMANAGPQHQRLAVLHRDRQEGVVAGRQAHRVRRGHRRPRRSGPPRGRRHRWLRPPGGAGWDRLDRAFWPRRRATARSRALGELAAAPVRSSVLRSIGRLVPARIPASRSSARRGRRSTPPPRRGRRRRAASSSSRRRGESASITRAAVDDIASSSGPAPATLRSGTRDHVLLRRG